MNILYVSGSPRKRSNTDYLLKFTLDQTGGEFIKLTDYTISPCRACWACLENASCVIRDDMSAMITPRLMAADAIVIGTPVYFNNVTAQLKCFIDRTWAIRGQLKNKIGATIVVGRRYGDEGAITAVHAFFLKHEMIIANRGISGVGFRSGDVRNDTESLEATTRLASRILELGTRFNTARRDST